MRKVDTHPIEKESFGIILGELGEHAFTPQELSIVLRVIHATADFEFKETLRFQPGAIEAGLAALRRGCCIYTDVNMVKAGISNKLLERLGGSTHCDIAHPQVVETARQEAGITRSAAAMRLNRAGLSGNIVVIGNAPTALLAVNRLIRLESIQPALVIGVPVGFVKAVESKDELCTVPVPYITAMGRKGGSTVAAAITNALLRLALE